MNKGEFITVISNLFREYKPGSLEIFDTLSEIYDKLKVSPEQQPTAPACQQGQQA